MSLLKYSLQDRDHGCQVVGWELVAHPQDKTDYHLKVSIRKLKKGGRKNHYKKFEVLNVFNPVYAYRIINEMYYF